MSPDQSQRPDPMPATLQRFIDTVNRGDADGFLAFFPPAGIVDDWGRRMVGHAAIREWSDREFIGAKGTLTPQKVRETRLGISLTADWASQFYSGVSRFVFVLDGEQIREMRITSA